MKALQLKYSVNKIFVVQFQHGCIRSIHDNKIENDNKCKYNSMVCRHGIPKDFTANPQTDLFKHLLHGNNALLSFALELNNLWKLFYREIDSEQIEMEQDNTNFIPLKHNLMVVPGGRFNEMYYWDSYWIIQVDRFGFVPNGTRTYYTQRSQPPLLTLMVKEIYNITNDTKWLKQMMPSLIKEYEYWTSYPKQVCIHKHIKLSRYYSSISLARTESFYYDNKAVEHIDCNEEKMKIFCNIHSSAESGWDFSSRWFYNKNGTFSNGSVFEMRYLDTNNVIPVDLNSFLCKIENCLSYFCKIIGEDNMSLKFNENMKQRKNGMIELLWDDDNKQFRDWNIYYKCHGNVNYLSNFIPLWVNDLHYDLNDSVSVTFNEKRKYLLESLINSDLYCDRGFVTSLFETGEQWDYPNCWPPLNSIMIESLMQMGESEESRKLANIWIDQLYQTYLKTNQMHEKYDCRYYNGGNGGEYQSQTGFGWTNGGALQIIKMFNKQITCLI
eukprot:482754_1